MRPRFPRWLRARPAAIPARTWDLDSIERALGAARTVEARDLLAALPADA